MNNSDWLWWVIGSIGVVGVIYAFFITLTLLLAGLVFYKAFKSFK